MKINSTLFFDKRLKKKLSRNPGLKKKVNKQLKILKVNANHPSLRKHKLVGKRSTEYAIWIEGNTRITFRRKSDIILLTNIINHDEY